MNDLMSGGLHRLWKDDLIALAQPAARGEPFDLLDVAGGTGDVAMRYARAGGRQQRRAMLCDINPEMIAVGRSAACRSRARRAHRLRRGQRRGPAVPRRIVRRLHDRLRHPQRHAHRRGAGARPSACSRPAAGSCAWSSRDCEVPLLDRLYDFHSFEVIPRLGQARRRRQPSPIAISSRASASFPTRSVSRRWSARPASAASATATSRAASPPSIPAGSSTARRDARPYSRASKYMRADAVALGPNRAQVPAPPVAANS